MTFLSFVLFLQAGFIADGEDTVFDRDLTSSFFTSGNAALTTYSFISSVILIKISNYVPSQRDSDQPPALTGSAERQAVGLFKGVNFQVWQTVLAWIDLAEDETLFVEGVEDFDVVTDSSGVTVQTKATERAITLRSESTIDALRNFWEAIHCNPGKQVRFRFVTTSSISMEEGSPFGGVAGLELWRTCARTQDLKDVERIRAFLVADPGVSQRLIAPFKPGIPPLIKFLRSALSEQILATVVQPLSWEVDQGEVEVAKEAVRRRLHAYGERMGLLPTDADFGHQKS